MNRNVGFGGSLFLIAVGAVLAFAVSVEAEGFNLNTIGYILMAVGVLGVILTLITATATQKSSTPNTSRRTWISIPTVTDGSVISSN